jgi:serine protease Do
MWGFGGGSQSSQTEEIKGTGTGIIMSEDGYIVTNAHVVYDTSDYDCGAATSVSVVLSDETEYDATVMGCDVETDIAVLKIDAKGLTAAEFGDSSDLKVGELVIAIGNPLGFELFGSVTSGIVSAVDREITVNEKQMTLIQTDAAINSGNSGGPLLNSCGQVIGINSAKMSSSYYSESSIEGLGFAIPISEAKSIIDDLINYGYVTGRPQIGIQTQDVSETISRFYGIPVGVYVVSVSEGSSAQFAGIKEGDVIIGAQGEAVTNLEELNEIKKQYKAGDEITLTISRQGEDIEISLVLQEVTPDED